MKSIIVLLFLAIPFQLSLSQELKPYILAFETNESISNVKTLVANQLSENGMKVVGQYQPAKQELRCVLIFTSEELLSAVKQVGGLSGFAATLRVGITHENGKTKVTYTNPVYWGNAYYREQFDSVRKYYNSVTVALEKAMAGCGTFNGMAFGSKKGISEKNLQKYHYMFGMPYFDDTVELAEFDSYDEATAKVEMALKNGVENIIQVYSVAIPEQNLCLYGFELTGEDGEEKFLPIIDIDDPKHTAFLPYEFLVKDGEVHMLHGRYRIALSFPDLKMGTFTKIMSTPGDIERLLKQVVE